MNIAFTSHHNWEWVFKRAITNIECTLNEFEEKERCSFSYCERYSDLPSVAREKQSGREKRKIEYALFRVDVVIQSSNTLISVIRNTSPTFQRLDAKDLFYLKSLNCYLQHHSEAQLNELGYYECPYLPRTRLVPWNIFGGVDRADCLEKLRKFVGQFPSTPAVLKAPMGSGGFGIYFVYHYDDIIEIMLNHSRRAREDVQFLSKIEQTYSLESIPLSWSLQEFICPIKCELPAISRLECGVKQRTQVRAYVIECEGKFYLYRDYEVRCPSWDIPLEEVLAEELSLYSQSENRVGGRTVVWEDPTEEECCGKGFGRPYNEKRNKKFTYRFVLDEVDELVPAIPTITARLLECFHDLKDLLLLERGKALATASPSALRMVTSSIIGIDLLVAHSADGNEFEVKIVEVNNNPAMPMQGKQMSPSYEKHLVELHMSFIGLNIHHSLETNSADTQTMDSPLLPRLRDFAATHFQKFILIE